MPLHPYLMFDGRCAEAIAFYREAVGAEVTMLMHFRDCPDQSMLAPGTADRVMHASLKIGDGFVLASDGQCREQPEFKGFALSLTAADEAEARRRFAALAEGGDITMPIGKTFFSPCFGMLSDRFGVKWMVIVEH